MLEYTLTRMDIQYEIAEKVVPEHIRSEATSLGRHAKNLRYARKPQKFVTSPED
jgi:hypothetical protein